MRYAPSRNAAFNSREGSTVQSFSQISKPRNPLAKTSGSSEWKIFQTSPMTSSRGTTQHEEYTGVVNPSKRFAEYYVRATYRGLGSIALRVLEKHDWEANGKKLWTRISRQAAQFPRFVQ